MEPLRLPGPPNDGESSSQGQSDSGAEPEQARSYDTDAQPAGSGQQGSYRENRQRSGTGRRRGRDRHIPTREDLLATLAGLPALVAAKILTPAEANSIRSVVVAMLEHLPSDAPPSGGRGDTSQLRDVLRRHPELLMAIQHLLPDAVLDDLLDDEDDEPDANTPRNPK